jgi:DNA transformation protein
MSVDADFVADLFAGLGKVAVKRMFGGAGVYAEGVMFALLDGGGQLFIKADEALREELVAAGSAPFLYTFPSGPRAGQTVGLGYWRLPDAALDDPDEAAAWGRKALAVAHAKAKTQTKPKTPKARRSK